MKPSVFLIFMTVTACIDDAAPSTTSAPLTVVSHDCNADLGYELDSYTPGTGGINMVGVFEPPNSDPSVPTCGQCLEDPTCDSIEVCGDDLYMQKSMTVHLSGGATSWVLSA